MLRMGVIGVGHLGKKHAEAIASVDGVLLAGIYDIRGDVSESVGRALMCPVFPDLDSFLGEVDAASIVVPTDKHYEVSSRALEAGIHILIEKPITRTLEEAKALLLLAKENGLILQVGHVERFNPAFTLPKEHIEKPMFIESHRLSPFVSRGTEVDVVLDLMIHDIDLTLALMGSSAIDIWAVGVPVITPSADIANCRLIFPGNRVASLTASRISTKRMRKLRLFQRDTYISMDLLERRSEMYRIRWSAEGKPNLEETVFEADGSSNPLKEEISEFVRSIRDGLPVRVSGEAGRDALELALEIRNRMFIPPRDSEG